MSKASNMKVDDYGREKDHDGRLGPKAAQPKGGAVVKGPSPSIPTVSATGGKSRADLLKQPMKMSGYGEVRKPRADDNAEGKSADYSANTPATNKGPTQATCPTCTTKFDYLKHDACPGCGKSLTR